MDNLVSPDDVLTFWFGEPGSPPLAKSQQWFTKDAAFDSAIRDRFGPTLEAGVRGELSVWRSTPRGQLATIILFDQFSRNMFRGDPRSFAQDALAQALTKEVLTSESYMALAPVERSFVLMPLMHAEDIRLQGKCVVEFEKLARIAPKDLAGFFANSLDYAKQHEAIIKRFGRFPHRNAILGRESTRLEIDFLKEPGSSF